MADIEVLVETGTEDMDDQSFLRGLNSIIVRLQQIRGDNRAISKFDLQDIEEEVERYSDYATGRSLVLEETFNDSTVIETYLSNVSSIGVNGFCQLVITHQTDRAGNGHQENCRTMIETDRAIKVVEISTSLRVIESRRALGQLASVGTRGTQ